MPRTLLRVGLWIVVAVLVVHVVRETFPESPYVEFADPLMLAKALTLGMALAVVGAISFAASKATNRPKGRCVVCRAPIPPGSIYCRTHLRNVLAEEHDRRHLPRARG